MEMIHEFSEDATIPTVLTTLQPCLPSVYEEVSEIYIQAGDGGPYIIKNSFNEKSDNTQTGTSKNARNVLWGKPSCNDIHNFPSSDRSTLTIEPRPRIAEEHYKCYKCDYSSENKTNFIVHLKRHAGEKPVKVKMLDILTRPNLDVQSPQGDECVKPVFRSGLKVPRVDHADDTAFKCDVGKYSKNTKYDLQSPKRTRIFNRLHNCRDCDFHSTQKKDLEHHQKTHIGSKPEGKDILNISSKSQRHKITISQKVLTEEKFCKLQKSKSQPTQKYKITVHNKRNNSGLKFSETAMEQNLNNKVHKNINKKNGNWYQDYEDLVTEDEEKDRIEKLQIHKKIYIGRKPYECEKCEYFCVDKYKFTIHQRIHSGEKPYKCNECEFSSAYKSVLKMHLRTHAGEKPFKCNDCDYSSVAISGLRVHKRIHTGEKPYKCSLCSFNSARKRDLESHIRTHTGEKPYKCVDCEYRAATSSQLRVHERVHSGEKPYRCDKCDYRSSKKYSMTIHQRIHAGEKPYKCSKCDYQSAQKCKIKLHEKIIHTRSKTTPANTKGQTSKFNNHLADCKVNKEQRKEMKVYQCDKCDFMSNQNYKIDIHQMIHPLEKSEMNILNEQIFINAW